MARGVALTLLLAPCAGHDALSLVQHAARDVPYFPVERVGEMADNFIDLSIHGPKRFRINMLKMVVNRDLPTLEKCCSLVQEHDIKPYKSWGSISAGDKAWWKENHCTSLIGATAVNATSLMSNCHRPQRISSLMRHSDPNTLVELYRSTRAQREDGMPDETCTEEERKQINDTATGVRSMLEWPVECSVEYEQDTSGTVDRLCLSQLFDVSEECGGCTAELLRKWADDAMWMVHHKGWERGVKNQTCFSECYNLRNCAKPSGCPESIKYCQDCMEPRLGEYTHCLGGPIKNQITMPSFFTNIIDVNWFSQR